MAFGVDLTSMLDANVDKQVKMYPYYEYITDNESQNENLCIKAQILEWKFLEETR